MPSCILEIKRQHQHPLEHYFHLCMCDECGYKFYASSSGGPKKRCLSVCRVGRGSYLIKILQCSTHTEPLLIILYPLIAPAKKEIGIELEMDAEMVQERATETDFSLAEKEDAGFMLKPNNINTTHGTWSGAEHSCCFCSCLITATAPRQWLFPPRTPP